MVGPSRTRLAPDERREQLLDLGVQLLASRSIEELSIDLLAVEAGISRGLLYHYFGTKHAFHCAVVERAADDLYRRTAPEPGGEPIERLHRSMEAYVDYVGENYAGYASLVRAAGSGREDIRAVYERSRDRLTDRIFTAAGPDGLAALGVTDGPAVRMLARGWAALTEEVVLAWVRDDHGLSREDLLAAVVATLPALLAGRSAR